MSKCSNCGLDHDNPGGTLEAITVLARAMPKNKFKFITSLGEVGFTSDRIPFPEVTCTKDGQTMKYAGEGNGPIYKCPSCGNEVEVDA